MTKERIKAINDWLNIHCHKCENNIDIGTGYVNCDAECEVKKDTGIDCIHYRPVYVEGTRE